jgi:hypothetical protein
MGIGHAFEPQNATMGLEHGTGIPRYTFNHMELFEASTFRS